MKTIDNWDHDDECDGDCLPTTPRCRDGLAHQWTSEGMGGCDQNPGVWSRGGTTLFFRSWCRWCGCARSETHYGRQRNPGQCDTVEYEEDRYPVSEAEVERERARLARNERRRARRRARLPLPHQPTNRPTDQPTDQPTNQ